MTLILLSVQQQRVVMVSDRRLSWGGQLVDDNQNKTGILQTETGTVVYAFTGLVRASHFNLNALVGDAIYSAPKGSGIDTCLDVLAAKLNAKFKVNLQIRMMKPHQRALTIVFAGFNQLALPGIWLISNQEGIYRDPGHVCDAFTVEHLQLVPSTAASTATYVFGNREGVPRSDLMDLNRLVRNGAPAVALKDKSAEIIRQAASLPQSNHAVGSDLMAVTLPRFIPPFEPAPASHFMTSEGGNEIFMADRIVVSKMGTFLIRGSSLASSVNISRPHNSNDAPCHCGSSQSFRHCHGRETRNNKKPAGGHRAGGNRR